MTASTPETNRQQPRNSFTSEPNRQRSTNSALPEILRSSTPLFLALIGGVVGVVAVINNLDATKMTAAMGLAGTAIAGAAGLAQPGKNESNFSATQEGDRLRISANDDQTS